MYRIRAPTQMTDVNFTTIKRGFQHNVLSFCGFVYNMLPSTSYLLLVNFQINVWKSKFKVKLTQSAQVQV